MRSPQESPEIARQRSLTIGIDASRALSSEKTGTENYTYELLRAIAELDVPDKLELYVNATSTPPGFPDLGHVVHMPFPRFWTHARLSVRMATSPPGVLFVPSHVVPIVHPRSVVVVHDLGYLHAPDAHPAATRRMLDLTTNWSAKTARQVIAISQVTKNDLIAAYGIGSEKITVIPHGVNPAFRPQSRENIEKTLARLGVTLPYILTVGTYQPRKNIGSLAQAMKLVVQGGFPHHLVIAGKRGWLADEVDRDVATSGAANRVQILGYVDSNDLPALYAGASAFCLPSLYEGFGMPVLEAMASGTPVITSNTSALIEVAGGAAITVDPRDVNGLGIALNRVLSDSKTAGDLRRAGLARASEFTWNRTALATLEVLRSVRDAK